MAQRYSKSSKRGNSYFGTSNSKSIVKSLISRGIVRFKVEALQEGERLDIIAQRQYGDARHWWIIAAASDIGWGLQVPAGTHLRIPLEIGTIYNAIG